MRSIQGLEWDGGGFRTLLVNPIYLAGGAVTIAPARDRPAEIHHQGQLGRSRPDGLTREQTVVYAWRDNQYRQVDVRSAASPYLYFHVLDAGYALERGDFRRAADLYRRALADQGARLYFGEKEGPGRGAQERRDLDAFSRFRLTLALLLAGDRNGAEAAAGEAGLRDAGTAFGPITTLFWSAARTTDAATGCNQARRYIQTNPAALDVLNGYGVASPVYSAEDVCPIR
jgi:hypothetical protein